ncbi:hypothetical protein NW768_002429 [Fusarium equiseti]|uniref:Uncharacterized protein n=1 Tax=Fusarium equiseti TaxID=61235 RepID=A0ABQ8RNF6_FUSEQ|nr:hypothetical protein NW768_002429 [Fusarium equiseti]
MERRPGPIIHINGYPGIGKYTIAKRLTELFPHLKLVHNKLFTDLADALVPRGTEDHFKVWENFREISFQPILHSDDTFDYGYIFTNFMPNDDDSPVVMRDYIEAAECGDDRQREFIAITLVCTEQENVRRLVSVERQQNGKLTDPEQLRICRATIESRHDYLEGCHHVIDVTNLEVEAAALAVARCLGLNDSRE